VAVHEINLGYRTQLQNTIVLFTKSTYVDNIVMEATEIELHFNNMIRDDNFCLRKPRKPHICSMNDRRKFTGFPMMELYIRSLVSCTLPL
jgi:hypothetical protein